MLSGIAHWIGSDRRIGFARWRRWWKQADRIADQAKTLSSASDSELLNRSRELRWQAKLGTPLHRLLPEAYGLVSAAAECAIGLRYYPVQLMGGIALFEGHVAEMRTGEGKTLTAVLPVFLRGLTGKGCHIVTANDYLAARDADEMRPIYDLLGLSVGCIQSEMEDDCRRDAYACDVTYGTAKEMGFDFLRDRLRLGTERTNDSRRRLFDNNQPDTEAPVQRGCHFALVDEADSLLIDEARTPLIIGVSLPNDAATVSLLRWSRIAAEHLVADEHFVYDLERRDASLTEQGCRCVVLMNKPPLLDAVDTERIYKQVERALTARYGFIRERDYVVVDNKVMIVDESTGRMMPGRKWQDGLHQAVEAKELAPITAMTGQAATITVQRFFRQYVYLAGMTGTAVPAAREFKRAYDLNVTPIPTHRPEQRTTHPPRVFVDLDAKQRAIVAEIRRLHETGRPILIGTPSVDASERLSARLTQHGISHEVLNATHHAAEADIVGDAGQPDRVTIATNMAGRGTDIKLHDRVREIGGLHIIATEMHSSSRIDRQLIGRCARQGDPGSNQFFLSLEDELLRVFSPAEHRRLRQKAIPDSDGELPRTWLTVFRRAQRRIERLHRKQRKDLSKREKAQSEAYERMGLDPYLELTESG